MGIVDHSSGPPPPPTNSLAASRFDDEELRELAKELREKGWAAVTGKGDEAKDLARSAASSLMRRRDIWHPRGGEGLPRYLATQQAQVNGDFRMYVKVDEFFVGRGKSKSPVRVFADGSRVRMQHNSQTP